MGGSIWWQGAEPEERVRRYPGDRYDVVVVGAGVTGLTTGVLLAEAGRSVLVVEARHPGAVTTGRTTGKVSALQGTLLSSAASAGRRRHLPAYVASTLRAQAWLRERAPDLDVTLEERTALTWADDDRSAAAVEDEYRLARELGLPARLEQAPDLPVPASSAVVLDDQLQLDPAQLVWGLVAALGAAGGDLVSGWRMRHVRQRGEEVRVSLHAPDESTEVCARHVVLATGAPSVDRRLHFARVTAQRSYLLAAEVDDVPDVMGLAASSPSRSFRGAVVGGRGMLLAGGAGHPTGRGRRETDRVAELRDWVVEHWPGARELAVWSAQDYATTDHLPLVGSLGGPSPDVHLATGFNKWGLSSGVAAALAISGELLGEAEPWAEGLYGRPSRVRDVPALAGKQAGVARGGAEALLRQVTDRAPKSECPVLPVCTHLGGPLRRNEVEGSHDCPLHGSRFDADGEVLEGPATRRLVRRPFAR